MYRHVSIFVPSSSLRHLYNVWYEDTRQKIGTFITRKSYLFIVFPCRYVYFRLIYRKMLSPKIKTFFNLPKNRQLHTHIGRFYQFIKPQKCFIDFVLPILLNTLIRYLVSIFLCDRCNWNFWTGFMCIV